MNSVKSLGAVAPGASLALAQGPDAATTVAQATEDIVDTVVGAAATTDSTTDPDDTLLQSAVWIVDAACAIAQDALTLTRSAAPSDSKAQQAAQCARTWSMVSAIVAVIVAIVVTIVTSVFGFGGGASLVSPALAAVAAKISAVITIVQALPRLIQGIVIDSLVAIQTLTNPATPADSLGRIAKDTTDNLRRAITLMQAAAAQHLPAANVDLARSLAVSIQTSRALQKLVTFMRPRASGHTAALALKLGQLAQIHGALAAQLKPL